MSLEGMGVRLGLYAGAFLIASGAAFGVYKHIELKGEHKALTAVHAATEAEHARRMKDLETLQAQFAGTVDALRQSEKTNANLLERGQRASHSNDGRACLDGGAADRLRAIGGRQASGGTAKPAGKAAR